MPTLRPNKGNRWMARVVIDGRQVACKMFPPGKKGGPEWRAAKLWEEEQRKLALAGVVTLTALEKLLAWGNDYLDHCKRTMSRRTYVEKQLVMREFFAWCNKNGVKALIDITPAKSYAFLAKLSDKRGGNVANKYRKNLLAAWNWGADFTEDFPQVISPFLKVKPFPVVRKDRYVPPEEDMIKVLQQAHGQDLVFLLTLYFTGARCGEIFRLTWQDVKFTEGKIRLSDKKTGNGQVRVRWLQMHPELVKALLWWKRARPCRVDNVFMQTQSHSQMGEPFRAKAHFMKTLCKRAGVKPFGFHAIRHKSAAITFVASGLNSAQILMGHARATTTDRYIKSAGLYSDQGEILAALGGSEIGQMVGDLLQSKIFQEFYDVGEKCNPDFVTQ